MTAGVNKSQAKPLMIFVFATEGENPSSTKYRGFATRLRKYGGLGKTFDTLTVALENLIYTVNEKHEASVIDSVSGVDIASAAFVYFKSWQCMPDGAAALATYLYHKGVQFADELALTKGTSKLSTTMKLWAYEVRVPHTIYTRKPANFIKILPDVAEQLGQKFILKDVFGAKGRFNFYVTAKEAKKILLDNPDVRFIAQRYIENDGDYRIGIYMDQPGFVIKRIRANDDTHLNNTSTGGRAEYQEVKDTSPRLLTMARKAAAASSLQISGVDIIEEQGTGKLFCLEVNQGSQIVTGANVEQNIKSFVRAIETSVRGQYRRNRKQPMKIIGRRTTAKLKEFGIKNVTAKVDTGAYTTTLHAENIREQDGVLYFDIVPSAKLQTKSGTIEHCESKDFSSQKVKSSNGHVERRYFIRTRITVDGRTVSGSITLSDRSSMSCPLLLGRRIMRSRFLVNVELNEQNQREWKF